MQKIIFNERYGLQSSVFEGRKTQTRREAFYCDKKFDLIISPFNGHLFAYEHNCSIEYVHISRYAVGEVVAIAQSYSDIFDEAYKDYWNDRYSNFRNAYLHESKGWKNKMFVRADLMPHHIRITDIRCERLQDISDGDCIKEGIYMVYDEENNKMFAFVDTFRGHEYQFETPKKAFRSLIIALNGKKFWDTNHYVIVYEFEKID